MKAIIISIKPRFVADILNGKKTIEIRKSIPKCDLPIDVYIYCTKEDSLGRIKDTPHDRYFVDCVETPQDFEKMDSGYDGKGKVIARFWCDKVEEINPSNLDNFAKDSCLTTQELENYLWSNICCGYAIHITKLEIFDKPKELSDFFIRSHTVVGTDFEGNNASFDVLKPLIKAPQSWCYVRDVK